MLGRRREAAERNLAFDQVKHAAAEARREATRRRLEREAEERRSGGGSRQRKLYIPTRRTFNVTSPRHARTYKKAKTVAYQDANGDTTRRTYMSRYWAAEDKRRKGTWLSTELYMRRQRLATRRQDRGS